MANTAHLLQSGAIPARGTTVNPFVILYDAVGLIDFVTAVLGAREVPEARTRTPDGLLIHAELQLGDSLLLLAEPQEGWMQQPGRFQVWVSDLAAVIEAAVARGATIVTPPTPFYGSITLARVEDPWSNLWWIYQPAPGQPDPKPAWEGGPDTIFRTLDERMRNHIR